MIRSLVTFVVLIFVIGLAIPLTYMFMSNINDAVQGNALMGNTSQTVMQEQTTGFGNVWDYTFLTIFIGGLIGILALAYVLSSNPALFFGLLLVVMLLGGFAGYLSNAFADVLLDAEIGAAASNFPITSFIINNYMGFVLGAGFLMLIVFFAKPSEGFG